MMIMSDAPDATIVRDAGLVSSEKMFLGRALKRMFDVAFSMIGIITSCLLLGAIALAIKIADGGPVLFKQVRIGKGGKEFRCLKFRTMVVDAEKVLQDFLDADEDARREWASNQKLVRDPRITAIGSFLRKTSLDELPQIFNVLVGDMSIVGPRPIVASEMARYGDKLKKYLAVRPGVTGLWQVSGRSNTTYAERVALDARYVENWTLRADMAIVLKTIPAVILQSGSC